MEGKEKTEGLLQMKGDKRDKTAKYKEYFWTALLAYFKKHDRGDN